VRFTVRGVGHVRWSGLGLPPFPDGSSSLAERRGRSVEDGAAGEFSRRTGGKESIHSMCCIIHILLDIVPNLFLSFVPHLFPVSVCLFC